MRTIAAVTALFALTGFQQDGDRKAAEEKRTRAAIELMRSDEKTADEALLRVVQLGPPAIAPLRASLEDEDPRFRRRVRTAMGRITGQWGADGRLVWKRSMKEACDAAEGRKPIVLLHLFGNFDEEFC